MMTRVHQNIPALSATRHLQRSRQDISDSFERLSSAQRINRAADDPAGLVISENLRAQTAGLERTIRNTQDKVNRLQTEDARLNEVFHQLRSIQTQALDSLDSGVSGETIQAANRVSVYSAVSAVSKILASLETMEFGVDSSSLADVVTSLNEIDVSTPEGAQEALQRVDSAIEEISSFRGNLGAFQSNVLESEIQSLNAEVLNLRASESAIRDTDFAEESVLSTRSQILLQSNVAVLTQANTSSKAVLQLLGG